MKNTCRIKLIVFFSIFKILTLRTLEFWNHCQVGKSKIWSCPEVFVFCDEVYFGFIIQAPFLYVFGILLFSVWVWDGRSWRNCGVDTDSEGRQSFGQWSRGLQVVHQSPATIQGQSQTWNTHNSALESI